MPSHRLVLESDSSNAEWLLEWNSVEFVLKNPQGEPVFTVDTAVAHRVVGLFELYAKGRIGLASTQGSLVFQKHPAANADLRDLVKAALQGDVGYRAQVRRQAKHSVAIGLAMFVVAGTLFGLFCWYASWAPDPPPGHWIQRFGWLIHICLLVLLAIALTGPFVAAFGVRLWQRVRCIEHDAITLANSDLLPAFTPGSSQRPQLELTPEERQESTDYHRTMEALMNAARQMNGPNAPSLKDLFPNAIPIGKMEAAVLSGNVWHVKEALMEGADPNESSVLYGTALHAAANRGQVEVVKLLVEQGADPASSDNEGKTVAEVALSCGHQAIGEYLASRA